MQCNDNGDLHPCAYLSQTFSSAEQNYDIYDHELLAVIHALDHWHHYLQGTIHPITLLTNHKNLTYFRQPQKLSCHQACWMMFLQEFDLHFLHLPGSAMGPVDVLSHLSNPDVSSNNADVTVLPNDLLFVLSILPLSRKLPPLCHLIPLLFLLFKISLLAPHFFLILPSPIGTFLIPCYISKTISTYLLLHNMILFPLYILPWLLVMGVSFACILSSLGTTGGQVCHPSSDGLLLVVLFANR